jgi:hypothetical protein
MSILFILNKLLGYFIYLAITDSATNNPSIADDAIYPAYHADSHAGYITKYIYSIIRLNKYFFKN